MQTVTGQCLDMMTTMEGQVDFSKYTMAKYNAIVKWKTAFYSFYLPVACAMYIVSCLFIFKISKSKIVS